MIIIILLSQSGWEYTRIGSTILSIVLRSEEYEAMASINNGGNNSIEVVPLVDVDLKGYISRSRES